MLCSRVQLVKHLGEATDINPLPCRCWSCELCQPRRRARLIKEAIAGTPNRMLTLTCRASVGQSPTHRRHLLHQAWRTLEKRLVRQLALPAEQRWKVDLAATDARLSAAISRYAKDNDPRILRTINALAAEIAHKQRERDRKLRRIVAIDDRRNDTTWRYFAFLERTERGEPHLHILIRSRYIDQRWISMQMAELLNSPVCWIQAIAETEKAVSYASKYVGKEPAQFGKGKRYWRSRSWPRLPDGPPPERLEEHADPTLTVRTWRDTEAAYPTGRFHRQTTSDGWVRFTPKHMHTTREWSHVGVHRWLRTLRLWIDDPPQPP